MKIPIALLIINLYKTPSKAYIEIVPPFAAADKWLDHFVEESAAMPRPEQLSLELLQTFVMLADLDGDATAVAQALNISQPSVSKRLAALRRLTQVHDGQPWLRLQGKRWHMTPEGQRVRGIAADLVHRYRELERLLAGDRASKPIVSIACGQQAASGFVRAAIERFLKAHPNVQVRLATPRGKLRIIGVAGGQFDFAIVTDSPAAIHQIARREMHVEALFEDRFVLAANPPAKSAWGKKWHALPTNRPITATELLDLPFILPEPDAARRKQFDEWCFQATGKTVDVVLETGGWQTILDFAQSGLGVGLATATSFKACQERPGCKLTTRPLNPAEFAADAVRLVARKAHGKAEPEIVELAHQLWEFIGNAVTTT